MISKRPKTRSRQSSRHKACGDRGVVPSKKARAMGVEVTSICAMTMRFRPPVLHHVSSTTAVTDLAAEKAQRWRRCPPPAAVHGAAEAEALVMLPPDRASAATRLAPITGGMHRAAAQGASRAPRHIGKIPINGEQKGCTIWHRRAEIGTKPCPPQGNPFDDDGQNRTQ